jgi:hypothetical protein
MPSDMHIIDWRIAALTWALFVVNTPYRPRRRRLPRDTAAVTVRRCIWR